MSSQVTVFSNTTTPPRGRGGSTDIFRGSSGGMRKGDLPKNFDIYACFLMNFFYGRFSVKKREISGGVGAEPPEKFD